MKWKKNLINILTVYRLFHACNCLNYFWHSRKHNSIPVLVGYSYLYSQLVYSSHLCYVQQNFWHCGKPTEPHILSTTTSYKHCRLDIKKIKRRVVGLHLKRFLDDVPSRELRSGVGANRRWIRTRSPAALSPAEKNNSHTLFTFMIRSNTLCVCRPSVRQQAGYGALQSAITYSDFFVRRRFRSSSSHQLLVPSFRLTAVDRRTFPVAASLLWNSLPSDIQSSPSLPVFRQRSTTFIFLQSFPNIALWLYCATGTS